MSRALPTQRAFGKSLTSFISAIICAWRQGGAGTSAPAAGAEASDCGMPPRPPDRALAPCRVETEGEEHNRRRSPHVGGASLTSRYIDSSPIAKMKPQSALTDRMKPCDGVQGEARPRCVRGGLRKAGPPGGEEICVRHRASCAPGSPGTATSGWAGCWSRGRAPCGPGGTAPEASTPAQARRGGPG